MKSCDGTHGQHLRQTYALEIPKLQAEHTPCTVGRNSGRPDRTGGMYPFGWV